MASHLHTVKNPMRSLYAAPLLVALTGCVGELSFDPDGEEASFGTTFDLRQADSLWMAIEGHEAWPSFPGQEGVQPGNSPHGAFQSFHLNTTAAANPEALDYESIIVKRNFATAEDTVPVAITVMKRIVNYSPDENDWFYAKYDSDGNVDLNPEGVPLAGAVGRDDNTACVGCHATAPGGDYVFLNGGAPNFGTPADLEIAGTLWASIVGHETWPSFTGKEGVQPGNSPHGAFVSFHLNDVAAADETELPAGSIVVKRNQSAEDPASIGAITVMQKIDGFNPAAGDWFWAKFLPTGAVDTNPAGVSLAGAVGQGGTMGCIPCHASAPGGDFVFVNAEGMGP